MQERSQGREFGCGSSILRPRENGQTGRSGREERTGEEQGSNGHLFQMRQARPLSARLPRPRLTGIVRSGHVLFQRAVFVPTPTPHVAPIVSVTCCPSRKCVCSWGLKQCTRCGVVWNRERNAVPICCICTSLLATCGQLDIANRLPTNGTTRFVPFVPSVTEHAGIAFSSSPTSYSLLAQSMSKIFTPSNQIRLTNVCAVPRVPC